MIKKPKINPEIIADMLDKAVTVLFDQDDPMQAWKQVVSPDDIVGIKSNVWRYLPTPLEVEQAIKTRVMESGIDEKNDFAQWHNRMSCPARFGSLAAKRQCPHRSPPAILPTNFHYRHTDTHLHRKHLNLKNML